MYIGAVCVFLWDPTQTDKSVITEQAPRRSVIPMLFRNISLFSCVGSNLDKSDSAKLASVS